mmetsp:Transcript_41220/g.47477  ORF Transcript_41220/g.47477 Transcript_41220/m.47477 type:complete len:148 (-) Transcript_41220:13-456(-)
MVFVRNVGDQPQPQPQPADPAVPGRNQQQDVQPEPNGFFAQIRRVPTVRVMGDMMKQWRRAYTLKDQDQNNACCVCLEEFNKGEEVIELHCGKGHIFHPDCLEDWARRNKSCPLCRTDFVELARREHIPSVPDEERKMDPSAPVNAI